MVDAPHYVLLVTFDLNPGARETFLELVTLNARTSLAVEPGCGSFDVLLPIGHDDRVVLYEFYEDRAAFDDHCRRPHFLAFDAAVQPLVKAKSFVEYAGFGRPVSPA